MAKKEEYIRDFQQNILGIIETDANGDQIARAWPGRQILGFYRARYDYTTDFLGVILARGNTVVSLIYNQKK